MLVPPRLPRRRFEKAAKVNVAKLNVRYELESSKDDEDGALSKELTKKIKRPIHNGESFSRGSKVLRYLKPTSNWEVLYRPIVDIDVDWIGPFSSNLGVRNLDVVLGCSFKSPELGPSKS